MKQISEQISPKRNLNNTFSMVLDYVGYIFLVHATGKWQPPY